MSKNTKEKKQKKESMLSVTGPTLKYVLKIAWKKKKSVFAAYLIKFIAKALNEFKLLLLPKLLVDELVMIIQGASVSEHLMPVIIYVAITIGAEFLASLLDGFANGYTTYCSVFFDQEFEYLLSEKSMEMDFQYTEDPDVLDKQNKAKEGMSWYSGGVIGILNTLFDLVFNVALAITSVSIIAMYCPLLIPVQIIVMGTVAYFNYRKQVIETDFFLKLSGINRMFGYYFYELSDFRYGKDIRLYDSSDMMNDRASGFSDKFTNLFGEQSHQCVKNDYKGNIANAIRDGISYFYMGYLTLKKVLTLGDFTMCVSAASRLYQSMMGAVSCVQGITKACNYASKFVKFMDYPDTLQKGSEKVSEGEHTIEFRDVSFKYPRADEYVLEHVNITIRPGEHLSIVGLNGAGKTTFIKLLCRLYDVTDGMILIDGRDIRDYSDDEYRKLFAVVFQDFKLFAFSLRDNIEMGDTSRTDDCESHVTQALKLSGLYEDSQKLGNGIDTLLFKSFDEHGTELSGGQQQKAAISRALYRNAPVVILDEPTAALDPIAEYEIYKKFDTLVNNKSAIYISHRLSSCKFCDKIAVFAEKTIKEYGTHAELVKRENGIYAEMFNAQAQYYV